MAARTRWKKKGGRKKGRGRPSRNDVVQHELHDQYQQRLKELADPVRQAEESTPAKPFPGRPAGPKRPG